MIFLVVIFLSAFLISSVSAYFSIAGLTAIFPGAMLPIISMGVVLELGKLTAASFVYNYWKRTKFFTMVLLGMTIVLSLLSSVGVYGYLTRKHIEGTSGISTGMDEVAFVDGQITTEDSTLSMLRQSMAQGDRVINNYLTDTTKTVRAESARNKLIKEKEKTKIEITAVNKTLLDLHRQRDSLSKVQRIREVDVGPLKYLAALISKDLDIDAVVRWFILCLVFVLDPLAILLVIAGNIHRKAMGEIQPKGLSGDTPIGMISLQTDDSLPLCNPTGDVVISEEHKPEEVLPQKEVVFVAIPDIGPTPPPTPSRELDFRLPEKWGGT